MSFNTIAVIGLGYIGLPTAAMFASKEKKVIGVDVNQHAVDTINRGQIHIVEPDLDIMVKNAVDRGFLKATRSLEPADAFLIAVPTPFLPVKNKDSIPEPDLTFIETAAKSVAKVLKKGDLVVLESTSPVGTTEKMAIWLAEARSDLTFPQTSGDNSDIRIAHCPERVLPGHVIRELVTNDRVIGGMTEKCSKVAVELYNIFVEGDCFVTNARTAEMAKLTENASRDVSIAFANELSIICDKQGINVWELIELANRHPRVNILQPGPGVGGHCIAVDPWFIVSNNPTEAKLIQTARNVNNMKPEWVIKKVREAINLHPNKSVKNILCLGLSFKPDIDDLRESPAKFIVEALVMERMGDIAIVEPNIDILPISLRDNAVLSGLDNGLQVADIVVVLVKHKSFVENSIVLKSSQVLIDVCGLTR